MKGSIIIIPQLTINETPDLCVLDPLPLPRAQSLARFSLQVPGITGQSHAAQAEQIVDGNGLEIHLVGSSTLNKRIWLVVYYG